MATDFDKIAKKKAPAKKRDAIPSAEVTDEIREAVDTLIKNRGQIKVLQSETADCETAIIEHVRKIQDEEAWCDNYSKSYRIEGSTFQDDDGKESANVITFSSADSFSVPQGDDTDKEDDLDRLKKVCGKLFDDLFETERVIKLDEEVVKDETMLKKIVAACKAAGLDINIFDVVDVVKAKKDLDINQYKLSKAKLATFRTLVRQKKPTLK